MVHHAHHLLADVKISPALGILEDFKRDAFCQQASKLLRGDVVNAADQSLSDLRWFEEIELSLHSGFRRSFPALRQIEEFCDLDGAMTKEDGLKLRNESVPFGLQLATNLCNMDSNGGRVAGEPSSIRSFTVLKSFANPAIEKPLVSSLSISQTGRMYCSEKNL